MFLKLWTVLGDLSLSVDSCRTVDDVEQSLGLASGACYLLSNGLVVSRSQELDDDRTYHVLPRVLGGKGGFGSMLRAIGAQIEKTTSREACRDLSGRRVRDVNNEKKLKEWVAKQAEREREKEERRRLRKEKRERLLAEPQPKLEDPTYHEQYAKAQEDLQSALQAGLRKVKEKERKRKAGDPTSAPATKRLDLLGVGINPDDLDTDSDSDQSGDDSCNGGAGPSTLGASATVTSASLQATEDESSSSSSSGATKQEHVDGCFVTGNAIAKGEQCGSGADDSNSSSKSGSQGFIVSMEQECTDESLKTVNEEKDQPTLTQGQGSVTSASLVNAHNGASKEQQGENGEKPRPTSDLQEQKHSLLSSLPAPAKSSSIEKSSDGDMGPIDLDQYSSADELEPLGLEHLKVELMHRGLKCGGTIEERAQRLFSIKGLSPDQINPKLLAKPAKGKGQGKNRQ